MSTPTHEERHPRAGSGAHSESLAGDGFSVGRDGHGRDEQAPYPDDAYVHVTASFANYPPFEDVDRRGVIGLPSPAVEHRARNLVDQASAHHEQRHEFHAHPLCRTCHVRDGDEHRESPLRSPDELDAWVRANDFGKMLGHAQDATLLYHDGFLRAPEDFRSYFGNALSEPLSEALYEYVADHWDWKYADKTAWRVTNRRAMRWLTIHGRPPVDPWPSIPPSADTEGEFLTRAELRDLPTVEPLIDHVLPRHSYGILSGRDGSYKTFVALDWACCLATGRPWQGKFVDRVRVLYIAAEGAYGIDKRLDAWEAANGTTIDDDHFVVRPSGLNLFKTTSDFDRLVEHIDENGYGLIVVDTLRRVSGGADENGSEMGAVVDNLARLKDRTDGGSILVIAHTGKTDKDTRGYSGIEDDADFVWSVKRDGQAVELTNTKMKDGPDRASIQLTARTVLDSLVLSASSAGEEVTVVSEAQVRLLQTIQDVFPDGTGGTPLRETSGVPQSSFYRVLGDLIKRGLVVKSGTAQRPFYTPVSQDRFPSDPHGTVSPSPSPIPTPVPEIPIASHAAYQPDSHGYPPSKGYPWDGNGEES